MSIQRDVSAPHRTALVLGGGGPIGIAWEAGLLLGLADGGVDLARADTILGTSAGSIVGTHLATLGHVEELYAAQATPLDPSVKAPDMAPLMAAFFKAKLVARNVQAQRRSIAKSARSARVAGEQEWLQAIAGFLPAGSASDGGSGGASAGAWPARPLILTAIDVESGELATWTRASGVPLPLAVASSCAVPCIFPLVNIGDRLYMDGGIGSPTNAALAQGAKQVVILHPLAHVLGSSSTLGAERRLLEKGGSRVVTLVMDRACSSLAGMNLMDPSQRERVAQLARAQGLEASRQAPLEPFHG
ncbi:MAG TPA: patatin-like phospholipase family protein [Acidobacteriaceae bacterium]